MIELGFKSPSIVPVLGGAFGLTTGENYRSMGIIDLIKERIEIFADYLEGIALSIHPACRYIKGKGIVFTNIYDEANRLFTFLEDAMIFAQKHLGKYGLPISGIGFTFADNSLKNVTSTVINFK